MGAVVRLSAAAFLYWSVHMSDPVSVLRDMLEYAMMHPTKSVAIALIPEGGGMPVCSYSEDANGCAQIGALYVLATELSNNTNVEDEEVEERTVS